MEAKLILLIVALIFSVAIAVYQYITDDTDKWIKILEGMSDDELWEEYEYFVKLDNSPEQDIDTPEKVQIVEKQLRSRGYNPRYKDFM